jgi:hypothetical protein
MVYAANNSKFCKCHVAPTPTILLEHVVSADYSLGTCSQRRRAVLLQHVVSADYSLGTCSQRRLFSWNM